MSDPTLNHPAVKAYRDQFKFCPKIGFREDIISTVQDMELWKSVLATWGYQKDDKWIKHNPLNVKGMMAEYERRTTNASKRANAAAGNQRIGETQDSPLSVPERGDGRMLHVREGTRVHVRRGSETLEEILTRALWQTNRS